MTPTALAELAIYTALITLTLGLTITALAVRRLRQDIRGLFQPHYVAAPRYRRRKTAKGADPWA